jgi:hypothetical protein
VCDDHSDTLENSLLFCDGYHVVGEEHSPVAYHAKCLDPPLGTIAEQDYWLCPECVGMVDAILGKQPIEIGADGQFEYLVKWRGLLEPTWTDYAYIPEEARGLVYAYQHQTNLTCYCRYMALACYYHC